jgi:hypothetical protein
MVENLAQRRPFVNGFLSYDLFSFVLTGRQIRAARGLLGISAEKLSEVSRVGISTVWRAEKADGPVRMTAANEHALRSVLEQAGVEFIAENGGGAGVRMKTPEPGIDAHRPR